MFLKFHSIKTPNIDPIEWIKEKNPHFTQAIELIEKEHEEPGDFTILTKNEKTRTDSDFFSPVLPKHKSRIDGASIEEVKKFQDFKLSEKDEEKTDEEEKKSEEVENPEAVSKTHKFNTGGGLLNFYFGNHDFPKIFLR